MREMRWSWAQMEETPLYVRQFCWDFTMQRRRVENDRSGTRVASPGKVHVRR